MDPIVLIHGYSAESKTSTPASIAGIYGSFPDDLRKLYGNKGVIEIDLSRYVSLEDGISVDDISRALDRPLRQQHPHLLMGRFNVVVHSTGALVIRNWLRRFSTTPSPVRSITYLAGANLGSGWAHIGKGQLAKWARSVFQGGAERGVQVLDALELGSSWTIDLHLHFLRDKTRMRAAYDIFEFVIIGSQADVAWFETPIRYAKEDGSDGVIRVSASNVNMQYLRLGPTKDALEIDWNSASKQLLIDARRKTKSLDERGDFYEVKEEYRPGSGAMPIVPMAIPFQCAHSGNSMGIVIGKKPRTQVITLVQKALSVATNEDWQSALTFFDEVTTSTYRQALEFEKPSSWTPWIQEPRAQYDKHAQVIFRIRDQDGRPVRHYDVFFDSEANAPAFPIKDLMEDKHVNDVASNVILFYLRTDHFVEDKWIARLPNLSGVFLEVSATEPETDQILYLPVRYELPTEQLLEWIVPHRTTIIDVELHRIPSDDVFVMADAS